MNIIKIFDFRKMKRIAKIKFWKKEQKVKICIVQHKSTLNKKYNIAYIKDAIIKAKKKKCDLIVFPELFLTGYLIKENAKNVAETVSGNSVKELKSLCKQYSMICICGFAREDKARVFNSACVIDKNGELVGFYDKTHLFGDEKLYFAKGNELKVFDTSIGKLGVLICYDIEFPEPSRILALNGADIICCIAANMKPYNKLHKMFIKTRAMENGIPVVYCNYIGKDEDFDYVGESNIVDVNGKYMFKSSKKNKLFYGSLVDSKIKDDNINYLKNRREDLY